MTNQKLDYKGIALFEMAKKHWKIQEAYYKELCEHLGDKDDDCGWIYQCVFEDKSYQEVIEHVDDWKERKRSEGNQ